MVKTWVVYDKATGRFYGWVHVCEVCDRILDGHWLNGHHDIILNLLTQETKGGCDRCLSPM